MSELHGPDCLCTGCKLATAYAHNSADGHPALRQRFRPVIEAENALAQAIFLCDDLAEKQSNNHPEGNDFVTHYVVPHGLWAQVLREKQNLRDAIHKTLWPDLKEGDG